MDNLNEFIKKFANQFDDTNINEINSDTNFRELAEWSSLTSLAVLNMIGKKYGILLKNNEINEISTIAELYELIITKKQK